MFMKCPPGASRRLLQPRMQPVVLIYKNSARSHFAVVSEASSLSRRHNSTNEDVRRPSSWRDLPKPARNKDPPIIPSSSSRTREFRPRSWRDLPASKDQSSNCPRLDGHSIFSLVETLKNEQTSRAAATGAVAELANRVDRASLRHYTQAVKALGRKSMWQNAVFLLTAAQEAGIADSILEIAVISACGQNMQWQACMALLPKAAGEDVHASAGGHEHPAVTSWNATISACEKASAWTWSLALFDSIAAQRLSPSVVSYNSTISAAGKGSHWNFALCLLSDAGRKSLQPNVISYSSTVSACETGNQWAWALRLLGDMADASVPPHVITCSAAISACEKGSRWDNALAVLDRMLLHGPAPNIISYNAAMSACEKGQRWDMALYLLSSLRTRNPSCLIPNTITFNTAINACRRGLLWNTAIHILRVQMPVLGLKCSSVSFTSAITACAAASMWQHAVQVLDEGRKTRSADLVTFNAAMAALAEGHVWKAALQHFGSMCQRSYGSPAPDTCTIDSLVSACERGTQWNIALQIFDDAYLQSPGMWGPLRPTAVSFAIAVNACMRSTRWVQALALHRDTFLESGTRTHSGFGAVITACSWAHEWALALSLAREMQEYGHNPRKHIETVIVPAMLASGEKAQAEEAMRQRFRSSPKRTQALTKIKIERPS